MVNLNLDIQKVKRLHQDGKSAELHGRFNTGLLKAAVFGANDGIVTTFAVVAGVAGAGLSANIVLIMGIANMFADALSMGLGDFLGERSERRHQKYQYEIEKWEIENIPEEEKKELRQYFSQLGVKGKDNDGLTDLVTKYPTLWAELGFIEEMKTVPAGDDGVWKTGLMTFCAFVLAGSLPLLPYLIEIIGVQNTSKNQFLYSIIATVCTLFIVGSLRTLITKGKWWWNGLEMLFIGSLAASASYFIGAGVQQLMR